MKEVFLSHKELTAIECAIRAAQSSHGIHYEAIQGGGYVQTCLSAQGIEFSLINPAQFCVLRGILMRDVPLKMPVLTDSQAQEIRELAANEDNVLPEAASYRNNTSVSTRRIRKLCFLKWTKGS